MPTRTRRAAAVAAASQLHDSLRLPEASEDEQMLARLEAYRRDLAAQFSEHYQRLERRIKKDQDSSTALSLALSRLSIEQRRIPFLDYLAQELGIGGGTGGGAAATAESEVDENDPISERVKRSMKRKKSASGGAGVKSTGAKRARAKAVGSALDPVAEDEAVAPVSAAKSVPGLTASTRQTRARAVMGAPMSVSTPLSAIRGANSANRAPATRGRNRAATAAAEAQNARNLGRPLKESETAFSSMGSPLINPFLLRPQDLRLLKRSEVSQLRKMTARLEELLQRA